MQYIGASKTQIRFTIHKFNKHKDKKSVFTNDVEMKTGVLWHKQNIYITIHDDIGIQPSVKSIMFYMRYWLLKLYD